MARLPLLTAADEHQPPAAAHTLFKFHIFNSPWMVAWRSSWYLIFSPSASDLVISSDPNVSILLSSRDIHNTRVIGEIISNYGHFY